MLDPADNLKVAMNIYGDKKMNNEAGIRTAVSRCYYSSLLTAKRHLGLSEPDCLGDDLHIAAISLVREADRDLGDQLKYLYNHRLKADMHDCASWDRDVIVDVHGIAKAFNAEIKRIAGVSGALRTAS